MIFISAIPLVTISPDDTWYASEICEASARHGLDPDLVRALIFRESKFDCYAKGAAGERGLMQVTPDSVGREWARSKHIPYPGSSAFFDVRRNLDAGCRYLAVGFREYSGYRQCAELALARYNAGPSRARRWRPKKASGDVMGNIDIKSTHAYVKAIMDRYAMYKSRRNAK
ncbi:MAG: transglycosylase SLT domain-containing protein [Victivallaceae bacterium]|nr:transglycosylase SLT domain-containing protein [Victivallaceae bacterium]